MGSRFDPYHEWLGIPPEEQPPHHYRLLGLRLFEDKPGVIENAADQRMGHLRTFQTGRHGAWSQRLLNEVAAARVCLLNSQKKAAYDARLRDTLPAAETSDERFATEMAHVLGAASGSSAKTVRPPQRRLLPTLGLGVAGLLVIGGFVFWSGFRSVAKAPAPARPVTPVAVATKPTLPPAPPREASQPTPEPSAAPPVVSRPAEPIAEPSAELPKPVPTPTLAPAPLGHLELAQAQPSAPTAAAVEAAPTSPVRSASPVPNSDLKSSVPDDAALVPAVKLAADIFRDEYDQARTPAALQALAKKILQQAGEVKDDVAARFVFLRLARDVATKAGDAATAFAAIEQMAERFTIDPWSMKGVVLAAAAKQAHDKSEHRAVAQQALTVLREALHQDALDAAEPLGRLALAEGSRVRDRETVAAARAALKEVEQAAKAFARVEVALATLKERPDDAEANLLAGRYQCFTKGDWSKGLPLLAKGADPALKNLAAQDLASSSPRPPAGEASGLRAAGNSANSPNPQSLAPLSLADSWWDLAQQADSKDKEGLLLRAGYWYRQAAANAEGEVVQLKIEKRLAAISKLGRPLPDPPAGTARQVITNSIGMKLVLIPAGEFLMGSTAEEMAWANAQAKGDTWMLRHIPAETPQHRAKISKAFYMGMYPVTQGEYQQVMGVNPSGFSAQGKDAAKVVGQDTSRHPVETVSWNDAAEFCRRLSADRRELAARRIYRLPTEAEWEYTCRAGTTTHWPCGDDETILGDYAWILTNSGGVTHPVGGKKPNAWGLHDMLGNVFQWCLDWYSVDYYQRSAPTDPTGPTQGSLRVVRSGRWGDAASYSRSASRVGYPPALHSHIVGFRVVMTQ